MAEKTDEQLLADLRAKQNATEKAKVEERQETSTDRDSPQRVRPYSKGASRSFIGGGATVYKSEVNPTDFLPSDTSEAGEKLPDYYRNGRLVRKTITDAAGNTRDIQAYQPIARSVDSISEVNGGAGVLASIRLIDPRAVKKTGPDSGNPRQGQLVPEFSKFFLESVAEAHNEKFQIVETFNDFYVYFYGEKPPIYQFSCHLLNLLNYNWKNEFMYFYENFWRGSKAVELGARIFLTYDYQQIQGYILNINTNINSLTDKAASFNFSILVTKRLFFNGKGSDGVVRDNLIPQGNNGFINTKANAFSIALTTQYLNGSKTAASMELQSANNVESGTRVIKDNASSTKKQEMPNPAYNALSGFDRGVQKAKALAAKLRF